MILDLLVLILLGIPTFFVVKLYEEQVVKRPEVFVNSECLMIADYFLFKLYMVSTKSDGPETNTTAVDEMSITYNFGNRWRRTRIFKKDISLFSNNNHAVFLIIPLIEECVRFVDWLRHGKMP